MINNKLDREWERIARQLRAVMLPFDQMWRSMESIGAPKTGGELGLTQSFYRQAVLHAREIRDRFTMLDVAGDARVLEEFAAECR